MSVPIITHRDLVAFADDRVNLKRAEVDDQRAQVNRLRDRIENKIAASPGYGFVKALHSGSVAKGTGSPMMSLRVIGRSQSSALCTVRGAVGDTW